METGGITVTNGHDIRSGGVPVRESSKRFPVSHCRILADSRVRHTHLWSTSRLVSVLLVLVSAGRAPLTSLASLTPWSCGSGRTFYHCRRTTSDHWLCARTTNGSARTRGTPLC